MQNYIDLNNPNIITATVHHAPSHLTFRVCAKIIHLIGDDIEPQKQEGEIGSFVYSENCPEETYVVYILNKMMLEFLAGFYQKEIKGLHIHECVNTYGDMICWPEKVESEEEALEVLKKWSGMIGALLINPEVGDINGFYDIYKDSPGDWGETAIQESGVEVEIA